MAQLTVPIEFDHEDLQEMVEQAKREIAAACITKEQAKNMLTDIQSEIVKIDNPYEGKNDDLLMLAQHNAFYEAKSWIMDIIQDKIDVLEKELKENENQ